MAGGVEIATDQSLAQSLHRILPAALYLDFVVFTQNFITAVWGQCVMNYRFYHG